MKELQEDLFQAQDELQEIQEENDSEVRTLQEKHESEFKTVQQKYEQELKSVREDFQKVGFISSYSYVFCFLCVVYPISLGSLCLSYYIVCVTFLSCY